MIDLTGVPANKLRSWLRYERARECARFQRFYFGRCRVGCVGAPAVDSALAFAARCGIPAQRLLALHVLYEVVCGRLP